MASFPCLYPQKAKQGRRSQSQQDEDDGDDSDDDDDNNSNKMPWEISKKQRENIDAFVNCVRIPSGYSQDFQVKSPFQQTDILKMAGSFHVGTTLMELFMHLVSSHMDEAYQSYFLMFSKNVQSLSRLWYKGGSNDLLILDEKMKEMVGHKEGLFPIGTQVFINHQMSDLVRGVEMFGSVRNFNALRGETIGGTFKNLLRKGGPFPEFRCMEHYGQQESEKVTLAFDTDESNAMNKADKSFLKKLAAPSNLSKQMNVITGSEELVSTEFRIRLSKKCQVDPVLDICFTCLEIDQLLEECIHFIRAKLGCNDADADDVQCQMQSGMYSLYCMFNRSNSTCKSFSLWVSSIAYEEITKV